MYNFFVGIRRKFFVIVLILFSCLFLFGGQYKVIGIKSSSSKLIGLWSTSQFLLNKDLDIISRKFNINFQKKQKGFKVSFVDTRQTNTLFSNSGIYYKCIDEVTSNQINIFIEKNTIVNENMATSLYYVLLSCSFTDIDQNSIDYNDFMNDLMRTSSKNNIFKSLFIPLGE